MEMQAGKPFASALRLLFVLLTSLLCATLALVSFDSAHAQSPLDGFAPGFNNEVRALALQSDGKLLVGGAFTQVGLTPRNRLVRLDPGGALDTIFSVSVNQTVHALAVDASDRVLVGGAFTQIGGSNRNRIARLNADGSLDTSFNPNIDGTVYALRVLEDGGILVAGDFTTVSGAPRAFLARLDNSGELDPTFAPTVNGPVYALAMQRGGALVIGGAFTQINGETRQHIARFDAGGTLDAQFAPNLNAIVRALAIGVDDAILTGGEFDTVNGATRGRLARFTADGALAATPTLAYNDTVHTLLVLTDGRVVVGGAFTSVGGQARSGLVRLTLDYSLDPTFAPDPNNAVYALLGQTDDKFVAGGAFTIAGGELRNRAARFYTDGSLDADFAPDANPETDAQVLAIAVQPDDRIVVGGTFVAYAGQQRVRLARFYADGQLDGSFNPGANNEVRALAIQPDGKIIAAGDFTQIAGQNRSFIARLLPDGQIDASFAPFVDEGVLRVLAVAIQSDGHIVMTIEPKNQLDKRPRLIRLFGDGSVDTTFQAEIDEGQVTALAIQTDGRLIACGEFPFISAIGPSGNLARLNQDGTLDANYAPEVTRCLAVRLQPDGRLLFGGLNPMLLARFNPNGSADATFTPDLTGNYVSSIALQSDGYAIVADNYEDEQRNSRGRITRVRPNGRTDSTFVVHVSNGPVLAVALQKDGKPVLGGGFTDVGATIDTTVQRVWLARLSTPTAAQQSIQVESDGATYMWLTAGAFPALLKTDFAYSVDGVTFTAIGAGVWTPDGWRASASGAPFNQEFFVRARGAYASGVWNASVSRLESIARMYVPGGALEVITAIEPQGLTPQWQVDVTGNTIFSDTLVGADTTGVRGLGLGVYTVTLSADAGTMMNEYRITYRCTVNGQNGPTGEGTSIALTVEGNDSIACTFTAVRRTGLLEVRHVISPTAPASEWMLRVSGPTTYTSTLVGDDISEPQIVFTGVYTLNLTQNGFVDYTTSYRCDANEQTFVSGEGLQATLDIADSQQVTCIFSSVRNEIPIYLPLITR